MQIKANLRRDSVTVEEITAFLDDLVDQRLAYAEGPRYLTLALPSSLPEPV